jgi:hypothetical protein
MIFAGAPKALMGIFCVATVNFPSATGPRFGQEEKSGEAGSVEIGFDGSEIEQASGLGGGEGENDVGELGDGAFGKLESPTGDGWLKLLQGVFFVDGDGGRRGQERRAETVIALAVVKSGRVRGGDFGAIGPQDRSLERENLPGTNGLKVVAEGIRASGEVLGTMVHDVSFPSAGGAATGQTAGFFKNRDGVPGEGEVTGAVQSGKSGSDDGDGGVWHGENYEWWWVWRCAK